MVSMHVLIQPICAIKEIMIEEINVMPIPIGSLCDSKLKENHGNLYPTESDQGKVQFTLAWSFFVENYLKEKHVPPFGKMHKATKKSTALPCQSVSARFSKECDSQHAWEVHKLPFQGRLQ